jgi:hypothetical protein
MGNLVQGVQLDISHDDASGGVLGSPIDGGLDVGNHEDSNTCDNAAGSAVRNTMG